MSEFTGERLIPGFVDADLFNEHLARYRFAARFSPDAAVLDAGCGTGYGTAIFTDATSVTAADISADAIGDAARDFSRPGVRFVQADCEALPFAADSFDLVAAFEVIEHLDRWGLFLGEARRVLRFEGVFVVSTPNKAYYTESRGAAGPNPFHCHEFELGEFEAALRAVFPYVRLWTQNHAEAIVFAPIAAEGAGAGSRLEAEADAAPENASFFVAVCGRTPVAANGAFAWVPNTANVLRERERHIAKLASELTQKNVWLTQSAESRAALQRAHDQTLAELEQRNQWAERLNEQLAAGGAAIRQLQAEAAARDAWVADLKAEISRAHAEIARLRDLAAAFEADLAARTDWALSLDADLTERTRHVQALLTEIDLHKEHLGRQANLLEQNAADLADRAARIRRLLHERAAAANSKWLRLGRKLNLGPALDEAE